MAFSSCSRELAPLSSLIPLLFHSPPRYLELQQGFSWLTALSAIGVFATARHGSPWAVLAAWSVAGFFMGPLTPLSFEHAAEMTFPVSANSSTTILNILGNLVGARGVPLPVYPCPCRTHTRAPHFHTLTH